jgi:hypothetical protein
LASGNHGGDQHACAVDEDVAMFPAALVSFSTLIPAGSSCDPKLSWRYVEAFEAEAAQLYAAPMDLEQMRRFANTLLEVDAAGTAATARHRRERANGIVKLWTSSPTVAPIAGTRWAAYNAVTEYLDHVVPVRGARTASDANTARALRTITTAAGSGSLKAQAFRLLQTL